MPQPARQTRLEKVMGLFTGAKVLLAAVHYEDGQEWTAFTFQLTDGTEVSLAVSCDEEGNAPGALLGLWELARERGI